MLVANHSALPSRLPTTDRQKVGRTWDYKPTMTLLKNGDLLLVSRTDPPPDNASTYNAIFFRSTDHGGSWSQGRRDDWNCTGGEFSLHTLEDSTVLLVDGGGSVCRSVDHGYTWSQTFKFPCSETAWSVVEVNASTATAGMPVGAYAFVDGAIWRSEDSGKSWRLHKKVVDDDWQDGDTFCKCRSLCVFFSSKASKKLLQLGNPRCIAARPA